MSLLAAQVPRQCLNRVPSSFSRSAVRDAILKGNPAQFFLLNADVASSFPLLALQEFHQRHRGVGTIVSKQVPKGTEHSFGCIVTDPQTQQAVHYVEKPESFISDRINAGIYLFDQSLFSEIKGAMEDKANAVACVSTLYLSPPPSTHGHEEIAH